MKITEKQEYTLLESENNSFEDFFNEFKESYTDLKQNHLIIQLSDNLTVVEEKISLFLFYSNEFIQKGMTFVVVCSEVNVDNFPETFNIVPTLQEAEDVLEMENIQRDLGF